MEYKKYLPAIAIIAIAGYLIKKLSSNSYGQVINRGIDFTRNNTTVNNRDAAQVSAFSQLASAALGITNIEGRNVQSSYALEAEKIRSTAQENIARITANSRGYDIANQLAAQDAINRRVIDAQNRQNTLGAIGGILKAISDLGKNLNKPASSGGGSSGGSGGVPSTSGSQSQGITPAQRLAARQRVGDWVSRNLTSIWNTPASYNNSNVYSSLVEDSYFPYNPFSYQDYFDNSGGGSWFDYPTGSVTSDYSFGSVLFGDWRDDYTDWDFDPLNYQTTYGD